LTKFIEALKQEKDKSSGKISSMKKKETIFNTEKSEMNQKIELLIKEREESINIVQEGKNIIEQQ
jgi:hypothetical protein